MSGLRHASVLVVDPDAAVREILQIRFVLAGVRPRTCSSMAAARKELLAARPDLLVIEAQSGAPDVLELLQDLQRNPASRIPTLVTGRRLGKPLLARLVGLGVKDCLLKPFAATEVLDRAGKILEARQLAPDAPAVAFVD